MSRRSLLVVGVALVAWTSWAAARPADPPASDPDPPGECSVIPAPAAEFLLRYAKAGPYANGMRLFGRGRYREAARDLARAWGRVRADLAPVFSTATCEPRRIGAVLSRILFRSPPLAVPGDDRFLPPPEVRHALARSLCLTGRGREAADLLFEAAMAGDDSARVAAGVLFASLGSPDLCLALLPETSPASTAALGRAYCLVRASRVCEARSLSSRACAAQGPQADALRGLLGAAGVSCLEVP